MDLPQSQGEHENSPTGFSDGLQYMASIRYVFQNPNWLINILLVLVCQLIPIVGALVIMGYQYEIVEALLRDPRRVYPDFNFNRFVEYLVRGVWPFLVSLLVSLVIVPLTILPMFAAMFMMAGLGDQRDPGPMFVVLMLVEFIVIIVLSLGLWLVMLPFLLRAGLTQDFAKAFDFAFAKDFVRRMWVEMLLSGLFMFASGMVLMLIGLLMCCVGIYPASIVVYFVNAHLIYQLYALYLYRGGQTIPFKQAAV